MSLNFSDFSFVPDTTSPEAVTRGDGDVLVNFECLYGADAPATFDVVDLRGREVVFERCGQVYFTDSAAGTREFVGYSYWEVEATVSPDTPCVNLVVLSATYDINEYPGLTA